MKESINVKIKKLVSNAVIPYYATPSAVGLDLVATSVDNNNKHYIEYGIGLAIEIPEGYAGFLFPRSSNSKKDLQLCNCVGIIDPDYRGEIKLRFRRIISPDNSKTHVIPNERSFNFFPCYEESKAQYLSTSIDVYEVGEKVAQLVIMPYPKVNFIETDKLSDTERGSGGFGSTGK